MQFRPSAWQQSVSIVTGSDWSPQNRLPVQISRQAALGKAIVLSNAFFACRESSRVCWATIGTFDRITLE
jgi:hypothetical protein